MPQQMSDHARPRQGGQAPRRKGGLPAPDRRTEWGYDRGVERTGSVPFRLLAAVVLLTAALSLVHGLGGGTLPAPGGHPAPFSTSVRLAGPASVATGPAVSLSPSPPETPLSSLPIGIVAGHWGNDSGAVCEGWLREVDINLSIAQRVVYTLQAMGYPTDLLEEFDPRLEGYRARALVSIHADSCLYPEASGFKVARVEDSAVPGVDDRLVNCLIERYQARTGLAFHEGSITPDMTRYHTFYEVAPSTPGAIIEVGFMLADRDLLLHRQDLIAQGIVEGILCFIQEEVP